MNKLKKYISLLSIALLCGGLTACNTFKGVGKDVERGGEKIQGKAHEVQHRN